MGLVLDVLDNYIDDKLKKLNSEHIETKFYIKSTLKKYVKAEKDLSKQSIVLLWFDAQKSCNFGTYQDIGDWVFFSRIMFPKSIKCDINFYESVGKSSYYKCYKLLNGSWPLYEELADRFGYFVSSLS